MFEPESLPTPPAPRPEEAPSQGGAPPEQVAAVSMRPAEDPADQPSVEAASPAEEDEPVEADPDAIPDIPEDWSDEQRFGAFRAWLEAGGPRYEVWAKDCIFVSASPPVLRLEFPEGFRANHVSATNRDPRLLAGVQGFFPGCASVSVLRRAEDSERLTHRETLAHEAAEAQRVLEERIAQDTDITTLVAYFDAAIRSVHRDHRAPTPPVLSPEEID